MGIILWGFFLAMLLCGIEVACWVYGLAVLIFFCSSSFSSSTNCCFSFAIILNSYALSSGVHKFRDKGTKKKVYSQANFT